MKISYHKRYGNNGACYDQTIRIDRPTLDRLDSAIRAEQDSGFVNAPAYTRSCGEQYARLYLSTLRLSTDDCTVYYLNLTQRDFINNILGLPLKDRNTCLLVA